MSTQIHPQSIVEDGAQLGEGVVVEAFAMVGRNAIIGDDTIIVAITSIIHSQFQKRQLLKGTHTHHTLITPTPNPRIKCLPLTHTLQ